MLCASSHPEVHNGDGLAAQFEAKFLFDRGEIGVEIDKQPIDRRIDHLYPTSRSYCSDVSKRSTLPRPAIMACSTACLEARSRNPLPRRIISTMLSGFVKVRGRAALVRRSSSMNVHCHRSRRTKDI